MLMLSGFLLQMLFQFA